MKQVEEGEKDWENVKKEERGKRKDNVKTEVKRLK
jgi:hypothetical protein